MIVRFRLGNMTETRPVHGKLDHHVSAGRKRDGFKQLHVSVEFTKYGNTLFRPVTGQGKNMTHYSGNIFFEPLLNICAKICILEEIIAIVSFICIQSSMTNERSMLIFQTAPPTARGRSACTDVKDVKCCLPF